MTKKLTLNAIQKDLASYDPYSSAHRELKAVLSYIINSDKQPRDNVELMERLGQELPAEVLFSRENMSGPTTLFRIFRDYLVHHGFTYRKHPDSNRIISGLIHCYLGDADNALALENYVKNSSHGTSERVTTIVEKKTEEQRGPRFKDDEVHDERRLVESISKRIDRDKKFSGKIGEDISQCHE